MSRSDAIVIGAGIVGCSLARDLSRAGLDVLVIERGTPGMEASWAAAGMLSPSAEAESDSPLFELGRRSRELYPSWTEELTAETGIDPAYRNEGTLLPFADGAQREDWLSRLEWQRAAGVKLEEITAENLQRIEPELTGSQGAFFLSGDHQVDNRLLMHALVQSCRSRGVRFLLGRTALEVSRSGKDELAVRLEEESGQLPPVSPLVVNAAGAWASRIAVEGLEPPALHPVKGHMLALDRLPGPLTHVIRTHGTYLVPRRDGRLVVGSTMEKEGFDKSTRAAPVAALLAGAAALCPMLGRARLAETWTGLRPSTDDCLPLLGPSALPGYWYAQGLFRNGILLAPITAHILSEWILTGKADEAAASLTADRFADRAASATQP